MIPEEIAILNDLAALGAWPAELPRHLSPTSISMGMRCAEQFRQRYILGRKEPPRGALVLGSADHKAHEHNWRQKIETKQDLPAEEVERAFDEAFDRQIDEAGGAGNITWESGEGPRELREKGRELVRLYHETVSPLVQPINTEEKITYTVDGAPVPVIGFVDVETERSMIERKTSSSVLRKPKPEWIVQGLIYQAVKFKPIEWHVIVKRTPKIVTSRQARELRLDASVSTVDYLVRSFSLQVLDMYNRYGPDSPWPGAITHPWACSYCGWRPECYHWAHERP